MRWSVALRTPLGTSQSSSSGTITDASQHWSFSHACLVCLTGLRSSIKISPHRQRVRNRHRSSSTAQDGSCTTRIWSDILLWIGRLLRLRRSVGRSSLGLRILGARGVWVRRRIQAPHIVDHNGIHLAQQFRAPCMISVQTRHFQGQVKDFNCFWPRQRIAGPKAQLYDTGRKTPLDCTVQIF